MATTPKHANDGKTTATIKGKRVPQLPHERDESSDRGTSAAREVMRRAAADVASGKQATDRGEATDATYQRQKS